MKTNTATNNTVLLQRLRWLLLGTGALVAGSLNASPSVFYNAPVVPVTPVAEREDSNNQTNSARVFMSTFYETAKPEVPEIFRQGPFAIRPHVDYRFLYANGVQFAPGTQVDTAIQAFSPGILLEVGQHWSVDYTPTLNFYSSDKFRNTTDHAVTLAGNTHYEDWSFGLLQTYQNSTQPLAETGTQTEQQSFGTSLTATRILNEKFSADFALHQQIQDTVGFQGSRDWSASGFLNYQVYPRLTVGAGTVLGYVNLDRGPDQTYQQLKAIANWRLTDKVGFSVNVGGEDRQFSGGGASDLLSPIFGASLQYAPRERTQLSLSANRVVAPSLFAFSPTTETTSLSVDINQRLFKKFQLNLGGSYNLSEYSVALPGFVPPPGTVLDRKDDYYAFNARLSHPFLKRGNLAVFYQYSDNKSTAALYTYHSSQVGCEIGYRF